MHPNNETPVCVLYVYYKNSCRQVYNTVKNGECKTKTTFGKVLLHLPPSLETDRRKTETLRRPPSPRRATVAAQGRRR